MQGLPESWFLSSYSQKMIKRITQCFSLSVTSLKICRNSQRKRGLETPGHCLWMSSQFLGYNSTLFALWCSQTYICFVLVLSGMIRPNTKFVVSWSSFFHSYLRASIQYILVSVLLYLFNNIMKILISSIYEMSSSFFISCFSTFTPFFP